MSNKYTRVIEKIKDYEDTVAFYEDMGYVAYELPKDVILMVHKDSPTEIISSATEAQKGDHDAYLRAIRDTTAWEYKTERIGGIYKLRSTKYREIQELCNKNGKEGWELVSVTYDWFIVQYILFFKKQID
jgi:hypothetical protein